jgi:hypothetical protein
MRIRFDHGTLVLEAEREGGAPGAIADAVWHAALIPQLREQNVRISDELCRRDIITPRSLPAVRWYQEAALARWQAAGWPGVEMSYVERRRAGLGGGRPGLFDITTLDDIRDLTELTDLADLQQWRNAAAGGASDLLDASDHDPFGDLPDIEREPGRAAPDCRELGEVGALGAFDDGDITERWELEPGAVS